MAQAAKILVVDDEPTILLSLSHYLQGNGANVTKCRERLAAEQAIRRDVFDLAIIDQCLSGGGRPDGLDLVRAVKKASPGTQVIVITAYGTDDLRRQALEDGAAEYIDKPVNLEYLLHAVQRARPAAAAA